MSHDLKEKLDALPGVHVREVNGALRVEPISDHDLVRTITVLRSEPEPTVPVRLSLSRMDRVGEPDVETARVKVGAGAQLAVVEEAVNRVGLSLGALSPGAMALTVGEFLEGPYAGLRAERCGRIGPIARGLSVVTPDALKLDVADGGPGPALSALYLGGQRRFGVVYAAVVDLVPKPITHQRAVFSFPSAQSLCAALTQALEDGAAVSSATVEKRAERYVCTLRVQGSTAQVERDLATLGHRSTELSGRGAAPSHASETAPLERSEVSLDWREVRMALEGGRPFTLHRLCSAGALAVGVPGRALSRDTSWMELVGLSRVREEVDRERVMERLRE